MVFTVSRAFAIGLFAVIYATAKLSDSEEVRYYGMVLSVVLLAATVLLKKWRQYKLRKIANAPFAIPGPQPSDAKTGNLTALSRCGSLHAYINTLTRVFGPVGAFYWGTQRVVYISSLSVLRNSENEAILQNLSCKPAFFYQGLEALVGPHSVHFANHELYHAKMQRVFRVVFGDKNARAMLEQTQYQRLHTDIHEIWQQKLQDDAQGHTTVDVDIESDLFSFVTKCVFHAMFGARCVVEHDAAITQIMTHYNQCLEEIEHRLIRGLAPDEQRKQSFDKVVKSLRHGLASMMDMIIDAEPKHANDGNKNVRCLIGVLQANKELYPTGQALLDELITTLHAIHKAYYALLWILYFVAKHESVQNKMSDEIQSMFGDCDGARSVDKLAGLKYCQCVVKESLRMSSIVSWTARVCPDSDIILKTARRSIKIAANMPILFSLSGMNLDESSYEQPLVFDPQRFKDADSTNAGLFDSVCQRACPGQQWMERQTLWFLAHTLSKFQLRLKPDHPTIRPVYKLLTIPNSTIHLQVNKRKFAML